MRSFRPKLRSVKHSEKLLVEQMDELDAKSDLQRRNPGIVPATRHREAAYEATSVSGSLDWIRLTLPRIGLMSCVDSENRRAVHYSFVATAPFRYLRVE